MLNLDPAKLAIIFLVALIVLGPERLPQAARQMASAWKTLIHLREQVTEEVRKAIPDVEVPRIPNTRSVTNFLTELTRAPAAPSTNGNADPVVEAAAADGEPARPASRPVPTRLAGPSSAPSSGQIPANDPSMN